MTDATKPAYKPLVMTLIEWDDETVIRALFDSPELEQALGFKPDLVATAFAMLPVFKLAYGIKRVFSVNVEKQWLFSTDATPNTEAWATQVWRGITFAHMQTVLQNDMSLFKPAKADLDDQEVLKAAIAKLKAKAAS